MQWRRWIGCAVVMARVTTAAATTKLKPPPVILDLGPVTPTPAPTPEAAEHQRLITTITVQNSADGESVVSFEATDVADKGHGKTYTIASKTYSLAEEKPKLKALRERILRQVRVLERQMLEYAQKAGPPKPPERLNPAEQPAY
jgi:hypothetical protein